MLSCRLRRAADMMLRYVFTISPRYAMLPFAPLLITLTLVICCRAICHTPRYFSDMMIFATPLPDAIAFAAARMSPPMPPPIYATTRCYAATPVCLLPPPAAYAYCLFRFDADALLICHCFMAAAPLFSCVQKRASGYTLCARNIAMPRIRSARCVVIDEYRLFMRVRGSVLSMPYCITCLYVATHAITLFRRHADATLYYVYFLLRHDSVAAALRDAFATLRLCFDC